MLTIEWQRLTTVHGYEIPEAVTEAALADEFVEAMERSSALHETLAEQFPEQAAYAVAFAFYFCLGRFRG